MSTLKRFYFNRAFGGYRYHWAFGQRCFSEYEGVRGKARDARRKEDLYQIQLALEIYYNDHGTYWSTGASGPTSGGTYSTQSGWLSGLSEYLPKPPVNPGENRDYGPWPWFGQSVRNSIYVYLNDGNHYIIAAWLEDDGDKDRLGYDDVPNPWNATQLLYRDVGYSQYCYVIAK